MTPKSWQKKKRTQDTHISQNLDEKALDALNTFIDAVMEKYSLSYQDVISLLSKKRAEIDILSVPVELFKERKLGILEIVVKYLKEEKNFRYNKIAELLNRDERTAWVSYAQAQQKRKARFVIKDSKYWIPLIIFANRGFAPLQALVTYLKEKCSLSYHEIGVLLHRDDRIIWATYNRT